MQCTHLNWYDHEKSHGHCLSRSRSSTYPQSAVFGCEIGEIILLLDASSLLRKKGESAELGRIRDKRFKCSNTFVDTNRALEMHTIGIIILKRLSKKNYTIQTVFTISVKITDTIIIDTCKWLCADFFLSFSVSSMKTESNAEIDCKCWKYIRVLKICDNIYSRYECCCCLYCLCLSYKVDYSYLTVLWVTTYRIITKITQQKQMKSLYA